jgi:hypothetical protein
MINGDRHCVFIAGHDVYTFRYQDLCTPYLAAATGSIVHLDWSYLFHIYSVFSKILTLVQNTCLKMHVFRLVPGCMFTHFTTKYLGLEGVIEVPVLF